VASSAVLCGCGGPAANGVECGPTEFAGCGKSRFEKRQGFHSLRKASSSNVYFIPEAKLFTLRHSNLIRGEPADASEGRAEALGCLAEPRDGVGDQIRYLRLRVAPTAHRVNQPNDEFWQSQCLGGYRDR
jgi:hypothetical protein